VAQDQMYVNLSGDADSEQDTDMIANSLDIHASQGIR